MLYRLNRLPDRVYIELLRLIGLQLQPPAAAQVSLKFSRAKPDDKAVEIPRGTRVTLNRSGSSEAPVFVTTRMVEIEAGKTEVEVIALHSELVEAEQAGIGTGLPGLTLVLKRAPVIASTGDDTDLLVCVESLPGELEARAPAITINGKPFRIWRQVDNFSNSGSDAYVYVADRMSGIINFAPSLQVLQKQGELTDTRSALAAIPPAGREIRVTYRRGGGPDGNVSTGTLTVLKDQIPGVQVSNPRPATGGMAAETLENALLRGPQQLHSLERAVTARDFELLARNSSRAIIRTRAITRAEMWAFAQRGTVEVLLVPFLPEEKRRNGLVTIAALQELQTEETRQQIQKALDERRPLGTTCIVSWTHYKTVGVTARIVVRREENLEQIKQRVEQRLHRTINPLPTELNPSGWQFGQPLRASNVYDVALSEPGVRWVDRVRLVVEETPDKNVVSLAADPTQAMTWYAGSNELLFRSLNNGEGWEVVGRFSGEQINLVRNYSEVPGLLAVLASPSGEEGSHLHLSHDCGETWDTAILSTAFRIQDMAFTTRDNRSLLLLAADNGLYELSLHPGSTPVQVLVDGRNPNQGFYGVAVSTHVRGTVSVILAAQKLGGIYLSSQGGRTRTYRPVGLQGEDIRELAIMNDGPRSFLWAGATATSGEDPGAGCFRWELRGDEDPPDGWVKFNKGWSGGTCYSLAFAGNRVLAASHRKGVLRLDPSNPANIWQEPDVRCGLPLRDQGRFHPVVNVAANPAGQLLLASGIEGVYSSVDVGVKYANSSNREFEDKVTLPQTWLFVSNPPIIEVVGEDEAS
jgi:hypothetical protein